MRDGDNNKRENKRVRMGGREGEREREREAERGRGESILEMQFLQGAQLCICSPALQGSGPYTAALTPPPRTAGRAADTVGCADAFRSPDARGTAGTRGAPRTWID